LKLHTYQIKLFVIKMILLGNDGSNEYRSSPPKYCASSLQKLCCVNPLDISFWLREICFSQFMSKKSKLSWLFFFSLLCDWTSYYFYYLNLVIYFKRHRTYIWNNSFI